MDNTLRTKRQQQDGFLSIGNMRSTQLREHIAEKAAEVAGLLGQEPSAPPAKETSITRLRQIAVQLHCIG
jgi:hypothetical protein